MKKFFASSDWGKSAEAVTFTPIQGNLNGGPKEVKAKAKKKKNKGVKRKVKEYVLGKGPLAPPRTEKKPVPPAAAPGKVKLGRVEKKNLKYKQKQRRLALTPSLAQAAKEHMERVKQQEVEMAARSSAAPSTFEAKLKTQLMGGRFRFINEQLYLMDSYKAVALFKEDPHAFDAYHAGYRHQVEKWPMNPLDRIIKMVKRLPRALVIGDFGCGEGRLAKAVPNQVHSMDLVSRRADIVACDMANTHLGPDSIDVAVYCLSLMGTNMKDYFLEANRVLRIGGFVYIAEIQSRFDDVRQFVRCLESYGFELLKKDENVKLFCFFQFKKVRNVGKVAIVPEFELKPCLYRKR